jgi:hypothetical protein
MFLRKTGVHFFAHRSRRCIRGHTGAEADSANKSNTATPLGQVAGADALGAFRGDDDAELNLGRRLDAAAGNFARGVRRETGALSFRSKAIGSFH